MGWFRGLLLPMLGVGFLLAILWFWFVERMGSVAKQQELYLPSPQDLAAIKQAALAKQQSTNRAEQASAPPSEIDQPEKRPPTVTLLEAPKAVIPTGRAVFNLGQEAPKVPPKPPQV